ncbi:MAG TPA: aspartyl/asparaginyl beta-hydroxylase domain-containing protein [Thermoanaerobaculia bacterium]|jgi:aspartate beta-hydroxylase
MNESEFDWNGVYSLPADLRFRPTPAGTLQLDRGAVAPSTEVSRDLIAVLLAFARAQSVEDAYQEISEEWDVPREIFENLIRKWVGEEILRPLRSDRRSSTRLDLFRKALEEFFALSMSSFPLSSHFKLQQPLVFFPGLSTQEIHDPRRFPWVAALEASFPRIQQEFTRLLEESEAFGKIHASQTSRGEWAAAYLWIFGEGVEETHRRCPETVRALSAIPGVAQFGTTLFSALAPHTRISPHFGYTNAKLRCQLPLRVPSRGCRLKVGDDEIEQREGRCIIFDDSFLHSAWNDSDESRFVLVFDFFHPDLTAEEVEYLASVASEKQLGKPYRDQAAAAAKARWVRS